MATDTTTTLLEERFLSSGYRRDMLNDKLATLGLTVHAPFKDAVHWIQCVEDERTWLDGSYGRMRIAYTLNPANNLTLVGAIDGYLRAFYSKVTLDEGALLYGRVIEFAVELAPMDSAWIKQVVSAPEKGK